MIRLASETHQILYSLWPGFAACSKGLPSILLGAPMAHSCREGHRKHFYAAPCRKVNEDSGDVLVEA